MQMTGKEKRWNWDAAEEMSERDDLLGTLQGKRQPWKKIIVGNWLEEKESIMILATTVLESVKIIE